MKASISAAGFFAQRVSHEPQTSQAPADARIHGADGAVVTVVLGGARKIGCTAKEAAVGLGVWGLWFAWHPVVAIDGAVYWLETLERRYMRVGSPQTCGLFWERVPEYRRAGWG